jgi:hypothetical protein
MKRAVSQREQSGAVGLGEVFCVTRCVTRMGKNVQIPDYS